MERTQPEALPPTVAAFDDALALLLDLVRDAIATLAVVVPAAQTLPNDLGFAVLDRAD
jgi:hypothetical protein